MKRLDQNCVGAIERKAETRADENFSEFDHYEFFQMEPIGHNQIRVTLSVYKQPEARVRKQVTQSTCKCYVASIMLHRYLLLKWCEDIATRKFCLRPHRAILVDIQEY